MTNMTKEVKTMLSIEETRYKKIAQREGINNVDPIEVILRPLEPKILKPNGKVNAMWIIFNLGLIIAKILAVLKSK